MFESNYSYYSSSKCAIVVALEQAFSRPTNLSCFCAPLQQYNNELFEAFFPKVLSDKIKLCNNNDQTWFSDTLTSARPLEGL